MLMNIVFLMCGPSVFSCIYTAVEMHQHIYSTVINPTHPHTNRNKPIKKPFHTLDKLIEHQQGWRLGSMY